MNDIEIIDNLLNIEEVDKISSIMYGIDFPWYLNRVVTTQNYIQFVHIFYNDKINSSLYHILMPIIKKLNFKNLIRIKANFLHRTDNIIEHGYHIDYENCVTAIFYLNSNNGKTVFQNGAEVESVKNRLVIFDSNLYHSGTTCTDQQFRCVINFNYSK